MEENNMSLSSKEVLDGYYSSEDDSICSSNGDVKVDSSPASLNEEPVELMEPKGFWQGSGKKLHPKYIKLEPMDVDESSLEYVNYSSQNEIKQESEEESSLDESTQETMKEKSTLKIIPIDDDISVHSESSDQDADSDSSSYTNHTHGGIQGSRIANHNFGQDFKGFSDKEQQEIFSMMDNKSERLYKIYTTNLKKNILARLAEQKGCVPITVSGLRAYLIHVKTFEKHEEEMRQRKLEVQKMEERRRKQKCDQAKNRKKSVLKVETAPSPPVVFENLKEIAKQPPAKLLSHETHGRRIQIPKRYLDGEQEASPKPAKRQSTTRQPVDKNKNVFQIGMLHPKYPKRMEILYKSDNREEDGTNDLKSTSVAPKKEAKGRKPSNPSSNLFIISQMLHSGELEGLILQYKYEEESKLYQKQLALKREALEQQRLAEEKQKKEARRQEEERRARDKERDQQLELEQEQARFQQEIELEYQEYLRKQRAKKRQLMINQKLINSTSKFMEQERAYKNFKPTRCSNCAAICMTMTILEDGQNPVCKVCKSLSTGNKETVKLLKSNRKAGSSSAPMASIRAVKRRNEVLRKACATGNLPRMVTAGLRIGISPLKMSSMGLKKAGIVLAKGPIPKVPVLSNAFSKRQVTPHQRYTFIGKRQLQQPHSSQQHEFSQATRQFQHRAQRPAPSMQVPQELKLLPPPPPPLKLLARNSSVISYGQEKYIILQEQEEEQEYIKSLFSRSDISVVRI